MPYYLDKSTKYSNIVQPHLSQFMGPWYDKSLPLAKVHKLIDQLFEQLPDHDGYAQNWHFSIDSWLPLYWKGYKQTTRYTYTIDGRNSEEDLWSNISSNIRRDIRKAAKEIEVVEGEPDDFDAFFDVIKKTFERKNNTLIYDKEIFKRLDQNLRKEGRTKTFLAKHKDGNFCAAMYLVWDNTTVYNLAGGIDAAYRKLSPITLLHWESIKFVSLNENIFDFEGSMLPTIEPFIRRFGATQHAYHSISKIFNKQVLIKNNIKELIQLILK